jgi:phenylalanyl-tRNA synthetase beta subunit
LIPEDFSYEKVIEAINKVKKISWLKLVDLYKWENIPKDKKSITVSVKIKWEKLTSDYINQVLKEIIEEVEKIGWSLR